MDVTYGEIGFAFIREKEREWFLCLQSVRADMNGDSESAAEVVHHEPKRDGGHGHGDGPVRKLFICLFVIHFSISGI